MPVTNNRLAKHCVGCWFLGRSLGNCDYLEVMGKRRPCPGGKGCTVKRNDPPPGYEDMVRWNVEYAKRLYERGASDSEIAKAVGASIAELKSYRKRKWGPANFKIGEGPSAKWDTRKGLELYLKGLPDAEIAREIGIPTKTLSGYRAYHWGAKNPTTGSGGRPKGSTSWDKERGYALYCLGRTDAQIARELGTTDTAVGNYRRRHWRGEK